MVLSQPEVSWGKQNYTKLTVTLEAAVYIGDHHLPAGREEANKDNRR